MTSSKTEYLKRYLENDDKKSKRKKKPKQPNAHISRIKILDRNIDLKSINFGAKVDDDEDEAPIVAEIIDDRPVEVKLKEIYESSRWKKLDSIDDDSNNFKNDAELPHQHSTAKENEQLGSHSEKQTHQKRRHDSDSDNSPPRMSDRNISRARHDSDSDHPPPRRRSSPVQSKRRHDSDNDNSPPRRRSSPVQSKGRHDSDSDNSPPRRRSSPVQDKRRHVSDSDNSPPRGHNRESGKHSLTKNSSHKPAASSNKSKHADSDSDLSPERIRRPPVHKNNKSRQERKNSDSDLSPPRGKNSDNSPRKDDKKRPVKTLSGLKAGLQNAATLREETSELRIREKKLINELNAELSGRNADTIVRDRRTGRKRDLDEENRDKEEKEKRLSEQQKKYSEWGKGIEQAEKQKSKLSDDVYEMTKPLARYCDDEDLEDRLKSIIHDDDPMSEYMRKKRRKDNVSAMPEYSGPPAPPNRFGIKPGYRWDGVDRSNGFEKKYFEQHSSKKATQEEAYLWSVQNM